MAHWEGNGNWDWRRRRYSPRVLLVRQFVPITPQAYPALNNPGVAVDCFLKMENIRATYQSETERLKTMINQCQVLTKDYLQLKLSVLSGRSSEALMKSKEVELYNLNLQKNQLEESLRIMYNEIVTATC